MLVALAQELGDTIQSIGELMDQVRLLRLAVFGPRHSAEKVSRIAAQSYFSSARETWQATMRVAAIELQDRRVGPCQPSRPVN